MDPRQYGGRAAWLEHCRPLVEVSGLEIVTIPHAVLVKGGTYLLYVHLDPHRGPTELQGGSWLLEAFGSRLLEVGADAMEQDLEVLVRKSWEKPGAEAEGEPPRKELAAASRALWLENRTSKSKDAIKDGPDEATYFATLAQEHPNTAIADFLRIHDHEPAVQIAQDPYTIAPDIVPKSTLPDDTDGPGVEEDGVRSQRDADDTEALFDGPEAVALNAFSTVALQRARRAEVELANAQRQKQQLEAEEAVARNAAALEALRQWREKTTLEAARSAVIDDGGEDSSFAARRATLRAALQQRLDCRIALQEALADLERLESEHLNAAVQAAEAAAVGVWDDDLVAKAKRKVGLLDAYAAFKSALGNAEKSKEAAAAEAAANPGAEGQELPAAAASAAAMQDLSNSMFLAEKLLAEAKAEKLPLPASISDLEPFSQADIVLYT